MVSAFGRLASDRVGLRPTQRQPVRRNGVGLAADSCWWVSAFGRRGGREMWPKGCRP